MKSAVVLRIIYLSACFFGAASIVSGGSVLFSGGHFRENVGNYVPFVVWSNFLLGFAYVITGAGLLRRKQWAVWSSLFILTATLAVFGGLIVYIINGGAHEFRTLYAMIFRVLVWGVITIATYSVRRVPG